MGFTAWSHAALAAAADGDEVADGLRWHYAGSPFCLLAAEGFAAVDDLFRARPAPFDLSDADSEAGRPASRGDGGGDGPSRRGGVFGSGPQRDGVVIAVEVMPPDHGNVQRVRRLNPPTAIRRWSAEAAEPAWTVGTGSATWHDPEPSGVLAVVADVVAAGRGELTVDHWQGTALGVTVGTDRAAVVLRTDGATEDRAAASSGIVPGTAGGSRMSSMAGGFVLGVDFGTSNTAAVLRDADDPADRSLRPLLFDGVPQLPSAVFVAGATRLAGRDALHHGLAQPAGLEPHPKRRIDDVTVLLSGEELPVAELFAVVLRRVREEATLAAGGPIGTLTLTCPIFWGPRRQSVLTSAARIAGLPEPVLVPEPVAAAAHYAATHRSPLPAGRPVLVFDLGAGTCDATVVRRTPDGIDIVAGRGLDGVGGLDVDAAVVASIAAAVRPDDPAWQRLHAPRAAADLRARNTLWDGARTAKEQLSRSASTFVYVPLLDAEAPFGREQFDALAGPVLVRTVRLAREIVTDAGLNPADLAAVLLVGGSSRLPLVASLLHRELGFAPILVDQPELAVALGSVTDAVRAVPAPVLPEPSTVPVSPVPPVSLRKAPRKAVPPEPVDRRTATRRLTGVVVVLLVGAVVAALLALDDGGDRNRAIRAVPSASATPAPAATGPFGNLSVRQDPDRFCRIGRSGPNAVYLDLPLILNWTTPRSSPTPSNVVVDLEITVGGEIIGPARYTHPENLRPTAPTAGDRAIDGYYRIAFDDSLLGMSVRLTVRVEADREVRDTDSLDNQFGVRVGIPTSIGPETRLSC